MTKESRVNLKTKMGATAVAAVMLLAGCAGSDDGSGNSSAAKSSSSSKTSEKTEAASDNCEKITKAFGQAILDGAPEDGNQLKYVKGAAVKSTEHEKAYYVAITFDDGTGLSEETGIWASTNLESGPFRSVDGFAKEFTQWPAGDAAGGDMTVADKGATDAKDCVS